MLGACGNCIHHRKRPKLPVHLCNREDGPEHLEFSNQTIKGSVFSGCRRPKVHSAHYFEYVNKVQER